MVKRKAKAATTPARGRKKVVKVKKEEEPVKVKEEKETFKSEEDEKPIVIKEEKKEFIHPEEDIKPVDIKPVDIKVESKVDVKPVKAVRGRKKQIKVKDEEGSGDSQRTAPQSESTDKFEPPNWRQIVDGIYKMKDIHSAPVDEMPWSRVEKPSKANKPQRFRILVGLVLSPQTNDKTTTKALDTLNDLGLLNVEAMAKMDPAKLSEIIKAVNFRVGKSKNLVKIAQICRDEYDGDIPSTFKDLIAFPGCGPKIANLVLQGAWNKIEGLAVDTHILRIARRLNFTRKPTKKADETQRDIEEWLPRAEWFKFNMAMVGFGQSICSAKNPKCSECLINKLCPVAFKE
ncbi:nth-like DNA glycosylase 1 [Brevipalpus obovatus]|uniref:nth-like DNA glycosylase 1 n=1 Tax=Brevipalpus obovatus TaxID=246614 RepID=UPI003D9EF914